MKGNIGLNTLLANILITFFSICLSHQVQSELLGKGGQYTNQKMLKAEEKGGQKEEGIHSEIPMYSEVEFSSIVGEFFVNPQYTGKITTVRTFPKGSFPRDNPVVDVRETDDGWERIIVSKSEFDAESLIATGRKGSLRVSLSKEKPTIKSNRPQPLGDIVIGFGELNTTLIIPPVEISHPGSFEVSIRDTRENRSIKGDIVAIRRDEVALKFHDLPSTVVGGDGTVRISLKKSGGDIIKADLKAWGYNIIIPDTGTGKPVPITAEVFGLPDDAKLKFTFESLPGQRINPSTTTLPVKKINMGTSLGMITTSITGPQALSVFVERLN